MSRSAPSASLSVCGLDVRVALATASLVVAACGGSEPSPRRDAGARRDAFVELDAANEDAAADDAGDFDADLDAPSFDAGEQDDAAVALDAATTSRDAARAPDAWVEASYAVDAPACFAITDGEASADCASGDVRLFPGEAVGFVSRDGSAAIFCRVSGSFARAADITTSYASCSWETFVVGADVPARAGFIVRTADGAHHARLRIASNDGTTLSFSLAAID